LGSFRIDGVAGDIVELGQQMLPVTFHQYALKLLEIELRLLIVVA